MTFDPLETSVEELRTWVEDWFEMRARGGANDAIRALLDLAPPLATVLRDGEPVEITTAEVQVGDLLLIRPGDKVAGRLGRGRRRGVGSDGP